MDIETIALPSLRCSSQRRRYWILLAANYAALFVGSLSSSLLSRFYFVHGGSSRWVSTWVQSAGFPLLLVPIFSISRRPFKKMSFRLFSLSLLVGLFLGLNNFCISWGVSYLPVSTSSLLLSSQLAFNLLLSILLVKQKLHFSNLNCVILITLSSVLLAIGSSNDRPEGVSKNQFFLGFLATLAAAMMFAVYLPIMEMIYRGVKTYQMVVEMQFVMEAAATVFAMAGMAADGGFREMKREGREVFDLGEAKYWMIIGVTVACWQLVFMGTAGMVFLTSSLNGGICSTALLSMNVLGGVLVFGDVFGGLKAVSLVLCLWGFVSYLYGEHTRKKESDGGETEEDGEGEGKEMLRAGNGDGGDTV